MIHQLKINTPTDTPTIHQHINWEVDDNFFGGGMTVLTDANKCNETDPSDIIGIFKSMFAIIKIAERIISVL